MHGSESPLCRAGFFEQQRQKDLDDKRALEKARKKELRKQVCVCMLALLRQSRVTKLTYGGR